MKEIFNKLALVTMLAGSVLSFNSCGDKEQIHGGNPVDPIVQPDNPVTPPVTDERLHTIGNGNYQFYDFLYKDGAMMDAKVASGLSDAKSYMNTLIGNFKESLEGNSAAEAYFADYISNMESISYTTNNTTGFDPVINQINNYSKPIFIDVLRNLDPIDRDQYIVYHQAMNAHVYGGEHGNINSDINDTYNEEKEIIQRRWTNWNKDGKPFEIIFDDKGLTKESADNITNAMDDLHNKAATRMGNGLTKEMLSDATNCALSVPGLDLVHDIYKNLDSHKTCAPVELQINIVDAMNEEATKLLELEQANYNNITYEYSK